MDWKTSEASTEVIPAWVAALQEFEDVVADSKVAAGAMRYSYATLGKVLDEVRPKLAKHELALSQYVGDDGVSTVIYHKSGQWISFPPLYIEPVGKGPQQAGSAISYARRYSILAICGLATEDDDGAAASVKAAPEEHDPVADRVNAVQKQLRDLDDDGKARVKTWADGRSLSANRLFEDRAWLSEVEAFLDEGLGLDDDNDDDMPETDEAE